MFLMNTSKHAALIPMSLPSSHEYESESDQIRIESVLNLLSRLAPLWGTWLSFILLFPPISTLTLTPSRLSCIYLMGQ
jgi:hypothetical protein